MCPTDVLPSFKSTSSDGFAHPNLNTTPIFLSGAEFQQNRKGSHESKESCNIPWQVPVKSGRVLERKGRELPSRGRFLS